MSSPTTHGKKFWSSKVPEAQPPFLNLGKQGNRVLAIAIPITDAHRDHRALREKLAMTVSPVMLVNQVLQVYLVTTQLFRYLPMADAVGVHSEHPVQPAHQAHPVHRVPKALQAVQEAQAEMAVAVHQVQLVLQAMLVHQVDKVPLVRLVKEQLAVNEVIPVPLVPLALQVDPAPTPKKEAPAETEDPVQLVHPALLVPKDQAMAEKDPMAHPVHVVNPAKMLNIVHARIAARPKPPKPKPRRKPRPRPKPKHKPDHDMVDFILSSNIYFNKFINMQMPFMIYFIYGCFGWRFLGF